MKERQTFLNEERKKGRVKRKTDILKEKKRKGNSVLRTRLTVRKEEMTKYQNETTYWYELKL